jgi:pimeloyl-ACP methyl ester carboxylesterase
MVALPAGYRAIAPDQRGFGDADPEKKIDATRGMGDLADDVNALLDHLNIEKAHIVGISLGGNVIWRLLANYPERFLSATLVNPGSPYGFGATRDVEGTPTTPDFAGSGAMLENLELMKRIKEKDRGLESMFSPRAAIRNVLVKPPIIPSREDELVESLLSTHLSEKDLPGDTVSSPYWPYVAPGRWGATNALSPKYAGDVEKIIESEPKTRILWVRGSHDLTVSDTALQDRGYLGSLGVIPDWPGEAVYPPQPMLQQTRTLLEKYAATGGFFQEVVIQDAGHLAYLEKPDEFNWAFHAHIK